MGQRATGQWHSIESRNGYKENLSNPQAVVSGTSSGSALFPLR